MLNTKQTNYHYFGQNEAMYQSKTDYGNNLACGHYIQSDDAKIYYEVYGDNRDKIPIVLLHGGLVGSPAEMSELADKLKPNRQIIFIATRGHARSEIGHCTPSYGQKADDVNAVLTALNIAKVNLIGFSDGGYTALFFAQKYANKTQSIVAIGTGIWEKGFVQGGRTTMHTFSDLANMDKRFWQEQQKDIRPEPTRTDEWFKSTLAYYDNVSVDEQFFSQIQAETLLLAGEKDTNAPLDTVVKAYHCLPNAQLGIIPHAPHPILLTDFNLTYTMITTFLQNN